MALVAPAYDHPQLPIVLAMDGAAIDEDPVSRAKTVNRLPGDLIQPEFAVQYVKADVVIVVVRLGPAGGIILGGGLESVERHLLDHLLFGSTGIVADND